MTFQTTPQPPADDLAAWELFRQAERAELPTCQNHPGRATVGGFDDEFYCDECVGYEIRRRQSWLRSFALVRGGVRGLL